MGLFDTKRLESSGDNARRRELILRIEKSMLGVRYAVAAGIGIWLAVGFSAPHKAEAILGLALLLAQNGFAHVVLWSDRTHFFTHPVNFLFHLGVISLIGALGYPVIPLAALYLTLIIGYCAYTQVFSNAFAVTVICAGAAVASVVSLWFVRGGDVRPLPLLLHTAAILAGGWTVSLFEDFLEVLQRQSLEHSRDLAFSEETLRVILDTTPQPILVYDEGGVITEANEQVGAFLGVARERLIGQHFGAFLGIETILTPPEQPPGAINVSEAEASILTETGEKKPVCLRLRSFFRANQRYHVAVLVKDEAEEAPGLAFREQEQVRRQAEEFRSAFVDTVLRSCAVTANGYCGFSGDVARGGFG